MNKVPNGKPGSWERMALREKVWQAELTTNSAHLVLVEILKHNNSIVELIQGDIFSLETLSPPPQLKYFFFLLIFSFFPIYYLKKYSTPPPFFKNTCLLFIPLFLYLYTYNIYYLKATYIFSIRT